MENYIIRTREWKLKIREITIPIGPSIAIVPLTRGMYSIIDVASIPKVSNWNWCYDEVRGLPHARAWIDGVRTRMHRLLVDAPEDMVVDHKNGDPLDNRLDNLRVVTHLQNESNKKFYANNKSGWRGVYKNKSGNRWMAQIRVDSKLIHLGTFDTIGEAGAAYEKASKERFGEFVRGELRKPA